MQTTRRQFMAASAAAALYAGGAGAQGVNERIGIAVIGCGGRGSHHLNELVPRRDELQVEIVALCDVWQKHLQATADWVETETGKRPKTFARFQEVLNLPEVDAVVITTPDFAHTPILIEASNAKKQVFVEKPMSINIEEAVQAVDTVEANKTICQVGTQHRSEGEHIAAARQFQTGILGTLIKAHCTYNDNRARWIRDFSEVREADVDWEKFRMHLPKAPFD
ncbi:MAG: Gfo/Idh/MocA family oxidoreductase, partial [Candidatus Hydrogenedentes bacterium]|nr:Gfo/Idh/MocA family oxidoreductase [Candidatus Hydrogenedentota bacterium]